MNNSSNIYTKPLFCICGETASGKDKITSMVLDDLSSISDKVKAICSYTSRPMRDNEEEGREHYFVTQEEFQVLKEKYKDDILAYTKICSKNNPDGYEYMALLNELEKANVYIIDPQGLKYLKEHFGDRITNIVVVYITASLPDRISRAKSRSDFHTQFKNRVINEFEQFLDFNMNEEYDYIIQNNNGEEVNSFYQLCDIIEKYI